MLLEAGIFTESREYFQNRRKFKSSIGSEGNFVSRSKVRRQIRDNIYLAKKLTGSEGTAGLGVRGLIKCYVNIFIKIYNQSSFS